MSAQPNWPIEAELFAELPESVGNITFTPAGDIIYSHHPFFTPDIRVARLNDDRQSYAPFPNLDWNTPKEDTDLYLDSVLGLRCDGAAIVWMMDMGLRMGAVPKLVGWNTNTDSLERAFMFSCLTVQTEPLVR